MKKILILFLGLLINFVIFAHPWKPSNYVIVDTDGGINDLMAISMLLASPDIRVMAVTVSPGMLKTSTAYIKVKSLLNSYHHEGLPVGINRNCNFKSEQFPLALNTEWGEEYGLDFKNAPDCIQLINEILSMEKTKVSFICLGGMSTASIALQTIPAFRNQVKEIIWSNTSLDYKEGFNYKVDPLSAEYVLKGDIPVRGIRSLGKEIFYTEEMIKAISEVPTIYAKRIIEYFNSDVAKNTALSYLNIDEMVVLYLHNPEIFLTDTIASYFESSSGNFPVLRELSLKILAGQTVTKNQVIKEFPVAPSFYSPDVESSVTEIINKYGIDEWTSGVIANELHRHLGVFAIVGVKMGIRAREYFDTGVDEFKVTSFAGSKPPLSCMNDGIQVSTGATPGHGLLTVSSDTVTLPMAEFTYLNHKIRLTLKPEIAQKISKELEEINFINGLDGNIYWELVRKNSIKYWLNLDRHDIFIIEEISG